MKKTTETTRKNLNHQPYQSENVSFWRLLHLFRKRYLIINFPFPIAVLIFILTHYLTSHISPKDLIQTVQYLGNIATTSSAALLAIVITGLAVLIALANGKLLNLLLQRETLHRLLFPFWLVSIFLGITLAVSLALSISAIFMDDIQNRWVISIISFCFAYSTSATIGLVGNTVQIGIKFAHFQLDIPVSKEDNE